MNYLSVCSGIEAATVAWHPLGWRAVGFSEIEKFPSQVLAHHYPNVPNLGDMTKFKEWNLESNVDVFVGGTPCQSFSVAGLRKGLDDPRGNLMLTYLAIARQYRPRWLVWENVPGVLSSNGGLDFASLLRGMGELGYGFAYRILDAQYFGVAQRRRRVFVVGYLGDWRRAAAVLFERYSLQRHPTPSRKKGESSSKYSGRGIADYCPTIGCEIAKQVTNQMIGEAEGFFIPEPTSSAFFESSLAGYREADVGGTLKASGGVLGGGSETFLAQPISFDMAQITSKVNGTRVEPGLPVSTLAKGSQMHVAQPIFFEPRSPDGVPRIYPMDGAAPTLNTMSGGQREPCVTHAVGTDLYNGAITGDVAATMSTHGGDGNGTGPTVMQPIGFEANMSLQQPSTGGVFQTLTRRTHASVNVNMAVRRLTPVECERLQGFSDNYTDIKPRDKATPDGPRYKALGNSMAVPVMAWIGKRIQEVENIK